MTKKEFQRRKKEIRNLYDNGNAGIGGELASELVRELYADKKLDLILDLYNSDFLFPKNSLWIFEVAYALNECKSKSEAERIYDHIVSLQPKNASALNNLSNLKKERGLITEAFDLIRRAYDIQKDEIITRNYECLLTIIREREHTAQLYQHALVLLPKENEFVIQKLQTFFLNAKKDRELKDNKMPIPRWKFKVMMGTDEQKAMSLLDQWLGKGYIRKIDQRGTYGEQIYEFNPLLFNELPKIRPKKVNPQWLKGIEQLNADALENLSYFVIVQSIERVKKTIRNILMRDLDELFLNFIMKNHKAVIILSGSIVEILLIYFCEKKHIEDISYLKGGKTITKKLYDCDLGDLLLYFEQTRLLSSAVVHMGNISRIYRNFVHPGKELREQEVLDQDKANICFASTMEIVKRICT